MLQNAHLVHFSNFLHWLLKGQKWAKWVSQLWHSTTENPWKTTLKNLVSHCGSEHVLNLLLLSSNSAVSNHSTSIGEKNAKICPPRCWPHKNQSAGPNIHQLFANDSPSIHQWFTNLYPSALPALPNPQLPLASPMGSSSGMASISATAASASCSSWFAFLPGVVPLGKRSFWPQIFTLQRV